jgi:hypothetical protein
MLSIGTTGTAYDNVDCSLYEVTRLYSVGADYGLYVLRLAEKMEPDVQPARSCFLCALHLGHQCLTHLQLHLHMSWETILIEVTPAAAGWLLWFG